jgi:hypothetical protein
MRHLALRLPPFKVYVALVIGLGFACLVAVSVLDGSHLGRMLTAEVALFSVCAFAGEMMPLKVVTRGVEGEVTTSGTFAFATLLVAAGRCWGPTAPAPSLRSSCCSIAVSTRSR